MRLQPWEAEHQGYTIDKTCYPWVAYKGPRFAPTSMRYVFTDLETQLGNAVRAMLTATDPVQDPNGLNGAYLIAVARPRALEAVKAEQEADAR